MDYIEFKQAGLPFEQWPDAAKKTYARILQAYHTRTPLTPRERRDKKAARQKVRSKSRRQDILARCLGSCWYCGTPLDLDTMEVDHVIPISQDRSRGPKEVVAACRSCNHDKGARTLSEYRALFPVQPKMFWGELNGRQLKKKYG